jgi:hypothetical protein
MAGSDPLSMITFALGKLEHTLPTACGGSSSRKASHHRRSRGRQVFLRCAMQQFSGSERAGCSQAARIAIAAYEHGHCRRMSVGRYGGEPGTVAM